MRPAVALLLLSACAKSSQPSEGGPLATSLDASGSAALPATPQPASDAARHASRDAEPSVDVALHVREASVSDPACASAELDLAVVLGEPRCAIGAAEAKRLRDVLEKRGGKLPLRQEAQLRDGTVTLRLVNAGTDALALPLSWRPDSPAFSALAEAPDHAVYELDPPKLEVPSAVPGRGRFARIVLAPSGRAVARVAVSTTIVRRIAPPCEAGTCAPAKLPPGRYRLHVGELVADVDAGAPARVEWTVR